MASETTAAAQKCDAPKKQKLHGRAFYESIGSPKYIVAPMVDQSEYAWRMLTRSFLSPAENAKLLAYTPMFHARLFADTQKYRDSHFQATREPLLPPESAPSTTIPFLDGNPATDRPLFVQFCANDPDALLAAARIVAPHCDAVDLNLGCPQGIARKGHYGAFLQEDQELIYKLINTLHVNLEVPVTAKIRILDTREATLAYARNVLSAGASILTVHGRRREQKGHLTGVADWEVIRWLREQLPKETVMFANGNVLEHGDVEECLRRTGVDGVMSAEGNLSNPGIFAAPPVEGEEGRGYWRGRDGKGGWRVDEVMRRYLDIVYGVLGREVKKRSELFVPGDEAGWLEEEVVVPGMGRKGEQPPKKKKREEVAKGDEALLRSPNVGGMQAHLFNLLRHLVTVHTDVRDALARVRNGDLEMFEAILALVEQKVARGLLEYERTNGESIAEYLKVAPVEGVPDEESSVGTLRRCKRPWWVVQPIIRPLPVEALAKGAIRPTKKEEKKRKTEAQQKENTTPKSDEAKSTEEKVNTLKRKTSFTESELVSG
ncbi:dihydrouridine synthase-domain-containing protein [Podospora aff. communis PSN243]|uniref:tRNA-dihydrouridine(16/17) synthase [NAD(P)(+)] n=1 Tax=Podospora aff. communis PSN243 TaxID=3040156 RepID=A0AAV9H8R6_9PEZI|nr:dihydrouridine synthase-domain-containing protein [Podospora aff. communis PSN243]